VPFQTLIFFVAGSVLLVAQTALIARAVRAARSTEGDATLGVDVLWTALPSLMLLALLAYSLLD
jgi:hypothetical protein